MTESKGGKAIRERIAAFGDKATAFLLPRPFASGILCGFVAVLLLLLILPVTPVDETPDGIRITAAKSVSSETGEKQEPLPEADVAEVQATPPHTETAQTSQPPPAAMQENTPEKTAEAPPPQKLRPADVPAKANVALVISDIGLSRRLGDIVTSTLPRQTSLAVSAYAPDPAATAASLAKAGHDVWLALSAQSVRGGIDPGPLALSSGLSTGKNIAQLKKQLRLAGGSVTGIYVPDDADITQQGDMWRDIALEAIAADKMVLDGTGSKVATELYVQKAESRISAYLKADIVIDATVPATALEQALNAAIPQIIGAQDAILIIKSPTAAAIKIIAVWLDRAAASGIRLVPASHFTGLKG